MLTAAVVGGGPMGLRHAAAYLALEGVRLVAVVDHHPDRRLDGVPWFPDVDALLATGTPELVTVATPPHTHRSVAEQLLRAGARVLVEKPLATTVADAAALVALPGVLAVGHLERANATVIALRRAIRGPLSSVVVVRTGPGPDPGHQVGAALDLAVHDLDLAAYLIGEPLQVRTAEVSADGSRVQGRLVAASGATADVTAATRQGPPVRTLRVTSGRQVLIADLLRQRLEVDGAEVVVAPGDALRHQLSAFSDGRPLATGEDGLRAVRLAHDLLRVAGRATPGR